MTMIPPDPPPRPSSNGDIRYSYPHDAKQKAIILREANCKLQAAKANARTYCCDCEHHGVDMLQRDICCAPKARQHPKCCPVTGVLRCHDANDGGCPWFKQHKDANEKG